MGRKAVNSPKFEEWKNKMYHHLELIKQNEFNTPVKESFTELWRFNPIERYEVIKESKINFDN